MKKLISVMMAGMLATGLMIPGFASSKDNITVNVDGNKMAIVGHPAVLDAKTGRVLIPFKSLFLEFISNLITHNLMPIFLDVLFFYFHIGSRPIL